MNGSFRESVAEPVRVTARTLDRWLGRWVYGNTNSFTMNNAGHRDIRRCRAAAPRSHRGSIDVAAFRRIGFVLVEGVFDDQVVGSIQARFRKLIEDPACYSVDSKHRIDRRDVRRTIYDFHQRAPELRELLSGNVRLAFEHYYQSNIKVMRAVAYRNYWVEPDVARTGIYANLWHCDARRPSVTKIMMNLSDVTERDGPFHIQSRARTRRMMRLGFRNRRDLGGAEREIDDTLHVKRLVGPAGTALLCNTEQCLHRAGIPEESHHRDLLMIQILPSRTPLTEDWTQHPGYEVR